MNAVKYRIDQHGPYRRWIVVRNGEDMSAHDTLEQAKVAVRAAQAIEAQRAETAKQGSVEGESPTAESGDAE